MQKQPLTPEEELRKKEIEGQFKDHCEKIFEGMIRWCMFDDTNQVHVIMAAFHVDRQDIAIKALEEVLNRYKGGSNDSKDSG